METRPSTLNDSIRCRPLLGTFVEIGLHDRTHQPSGPIDAGFAAIARIQELLSAHDPASDLSRLNSAGGRWVPLQPLSLRVIRLARGVTLASGHSFNCTVGGTMIREGILPDHGTSGFAASGTAQDIIIAGNRVRLANNISLTLDGIAKGYAVDHAVAAMKRAGAAAGWVNAGGDLRVFGTLAKPVHQRAADGNLLPLGTLENGAVASSRSESNPTLGFRGRIVSSTSPPPAATPTVWTVLADFAWRADALTKVAATTPSGRRNEIISALRGTLIGPTA